MRLTVPYSPYSPYSTHGMACWIRSEQINCYKMRKSSRSISLHQDRRFWREATAIVKVNYAPQCQTAVEENNHRNFSFGFWFFSNLNIQKPQKETITQGSAWDQDRFSISWTWTTWSSKAKSAQFQARHARKLPLCFWLRRPHRTFPKSGWSA